MMKARKSTQVKTISDPVSAFCTTILNTTTQRAYRTDLRSFVEWLEAKYAEVFDIASTTPSDVHVYKQDLIREGRSPATVNRALVSIGKFAKWCVTQDMRQDNFATRIPDCAWRSCVT